MSDQLRRIIKLAKKTGDRIIVFDNSAPDESFVVMGLDQYEGLLEDNPEDNKEVPEKVIPAPESNLDYGPEIDTNTQTEVEAALNELEKTNNQNISKNQSSYQQITNNPALTEEKITDRIGTSDKMWKNQNSFQSSGQSQNRSDNIYSSGQVLKNRFKNNNWQIPKSVKQAAEEVEQE